MSIFIWTRGRPPAISENSRSVKISSGGFKLAKQEIVYSIDELKALLKEALGELKDNEICLKKEVSIGIKNSSEKPRARAAIDLKARSIAIPESFLKKDNFKFRSRTELKGIIKHELVHQHLFDERLSFRHGKAFYKVCASIGAPAHDDRIKRRRVVGRMVCEGCESAREFRARPKYPINRYFCNRCKGPVEWEESSL